VCGSKVIKLVYACDDYLGKRVIVTERMFCNNPMENGLQKTQHPGSALVASSFEAASFPSRQVEACDYSSVQHAAFEA